MTKLYNTKKMTRTRQALRKNMPLYYGAPRVNHVLNEVNVPGYPKFTPYGQHPGPGILGMNFGIHPRLKPVFNEANVTCVFILSG